MPIVIIIYKPESFNSIRRIYFTKETRVFGYPFNSITYNEDQQNSLPSKSRFDISDEGIFLRAFGPSIGRIGVDSLAYSRAEVAKMRVNYLSKYGTPYNNRTGHEIRFLVEITKQPYYDVAKWFKAVISKANKTFNKSINIDETMNSLSAHAHIRFKYSQNKQLSAAALITRVFLGNVISEIIASSRLGDVNREESVVVAILNLLETVSSAAFASKLENASDFSLLKNILSDTRKTIEHIRNRNEKQNIPFLGTINSATDDFIIAEEIIDQIASLNDIEVNTDYGYFTINRWVFESKKIHDFICKCQELNITKNLIFFGFEGLSSGELARLELLSRVLWVKDQLQGPTEGSSILMCLDEADTFMHPEWQRTFLKDLLEFIETTFEGYQVQLVISTHSPFLLSDVPKENVLFLGDKKPKDPTFGANIHQLLSQDMFMQDTMGAFASSKIEKAIELLEGDDWNEKAEEEVKGIIKILGEPLIRKELERLLHYKHTELRLRNLEQEMKKLKDKQGGQD